jgi:hypothetical protein
MVLDRIHVPPAPRERFTRSKRHAHGSVAWGIAVTRDVSFEDIDRGFPLVTSAAIGLEDSLSVSAPDQIVVAHQVLLTGDSFVVAQEIDRVHIAVHQVPAPIIEHLRDAVPDKSGWRNPKAGISPQACQRDRIVTTRVISVDIEYLDGIQKLVVVAVEVKARLEFLPPQGPGFFAVRHPRFDGLGDDFIEGAEVVTAVREPGIDQIGLADILDENRAVGLPGLLERLPNSLGRPAVLAVHRSGLNDRVYGLSGGELMNLSLGHVRRVMVCRPRSEGIVGWFDQQ